MHKAITMQHYGDKYKKMHDVTLFHFRNLHLMLSKNNSVSRFCGAPTSVCRLKDVKLVRDVSKHANHSATSRILRKPRKLPALLESLFSFRQMDYIFIKLE